MYVKLRPFCEEILRLPPQTLKVSLQTGKKTSKQTLRIMELPLMSMKERRGIMMMDFKLWKIDHTPMPCEATACLQILRGDNVVEKMRPH